MPDKYNCSKQHSRVLPSAKCRAVQHSESTTGACNKERSELHRVP